MTDPRPLDRAAYLLNAILAGPLDLSTGLAVAAALATLDDVQPPPAPLPDPPPADPRVGIPQALLALRQAAQDATDADEALRAGLAAHELLTLAEALKHE